MQILLTQTTETTEGPTLRMDCPSCDAKDVRAATATVEERNTVFWILPLFTSRWVNIRCRSCGKSFGASESCEELALMSPADLSAAVMQWKESHVAFFVKFCIITSLVVGIFPFLGLPFGLIGVAFTFKRKTRWRRAAYIGLGLSATTSLILFLILNINTGRK